METEQIVREVEAHPTLSHHEQREVGLELQATLVELVDLALLGKQLHWSVVGPGVRPLHLQLDELVDVWRELADTVAERAVALGYWPDGQAGTVAEASGLAAAPSGAAADHRHHAHRPPQLPPVPTAPLPSRDGRALSRRDRNAASWRAQNRLLVLTRWAFGCVTRGRGARLITGSAAGAANTEEVGDTTLART